jgi:large subunit ribosomal protein L30
MSVKKFKVTLLKGLSRKTESQIRTLQALGLRKRTSAVLVHDTPANRGQILKVQHLVKIELV